MQGRIILDEMPAGGEEEGKGGVGGTYRVRKCGAKKCPAILYHRAYNYNVFSFADQN